MVIFHTEDESETILMLEYLFITLPCLTWLPSYSYIIMLFLQLYNMITSESSSFLTTGLNGGYWVAIVAYFWIFLQSIFLETYDNFVYDSSWLTGIVYFIFGLIIFFCGRKLLSEVRN